MKTFTTICMLSLFVIGCTTDRGQKDNFASLHGAVQRTLTDSYDCRPITTNEVVGGRYFEVQSRPRGLAVTVRERRFFSQTEWERKYTFGTNSMFQLMQFITTNRFTDTNQTFDTNTFARLDADASSLFELPDRHYRKVGVDVDVQDVDETYPGLEEEYAEARKCKAKIVRLLKPYRRAD